MPRTILLIGFHAKRIEEIDRREYPKMAPNVPGAYIIVVDPLHRQPAFMEAFLASLRNPMTYIERAPLTESALKNVEAMINGYTTPKGEKLAGSGDKIDEIVIRRDYKPREAEIREFYREVMKDGI